MATAPDRVHIVEVAPRDGLQNHARAFSTEAKIAFIDALSRSGLQAIETTSFVKPKAVPAMADAAQIMTGIARVPGVRYLALVPNSKGLERAIDAGVDSVALFASASETFSKRNINCTISESLARFAPVLERAEAGRLWVRGYVSMAFICPYEGAIDPARTAELATTLHRMGCAQICLADTIGAATSDQVAATLEATLPGVPADQIALHLHDTYGNAIASVDIAYERGIQVFDAAAGGLGGCPFAPNAPGNLATETLIQYLDRRGISHGVDIDAIRQATSNLLASPAI